MSYSLFSQQLQHEVSSATLIDMGLSSHREEELSDIFTSTQEAVAAGDVITLTEMFAQSAESQADEVMRDLHRAGKDLSD